MLRHIVMIKFADRASNDKSSEELKKMLIDLLTEIPELKSMEVGLNVNTKASAYDLVLTSDFDDENGLNAYREHPEHQKVLDYLQIVMEKATVVDYYI